MKNAPPQLKPKAATTKPVPWLKRIAPVFDKVGVLFLVATVVMVACLLLFILWINPSRPVARISNRDGMATILTTHAFQRRLAIERTRGVNLQKEQAAKANIHPADFEPDYRPLATLSFAAGVIDRLTREVLIQEESARRGVTVSDDEIDLTIARVYDLVVWPKDTPPPPNPSAAAWLAAKPDMREQARKVRVEAQRRLEQDGLPKDYRQIVRLELLEDKLKDAFFSDIPIEQDRVIFKLIRLETEADAQAASAFLRQGETFDALYDRVAQGLVSGATGTLRDWSSRAELERDFNVQFGQTVMGLRAGESVNQLIAAAHGWYLVKVEHREIRKMPEDWRRQRGVDAMRTWLEQQNTRIVQYPEWMKYVSPTPPIPNRGYAGDLPPRAGDAGLAGMPKMPGVPFVGGKPTTGARQPLAGQGRTDASASGQRMFHTPAAWPSAEAGQAPASPALPIEQLQNSPVDPVRPGTHQPTDSLLPGAPGPAGPTPAEP
jgi:hypothetical protein